MTAYRLEHAAKLQADIAAALSTKAQELARHAREAAALYAELEDGKLEAKRLIPPQGKVRLRTPESRRTAAY